MGTRLDMIICGHSMQEGHRLTEILLLELRRLELLMSRFQKESPVWMVNHLAGKKSLPVDDELFNILLNCKEYHELTDGLFDIALGSVVDLIRQGEYDPATFRKYLDSSGMKQVILDPDKMTIRFQNELVQVDFGGFGKGYALERIRKLLLSHEILNAFISFGESSVLALGNHPHGAGWKAGVNHQMITGNSLFSFDLQNESLSTSGIISGHGETGSFGQILHPVRGITEKKYHHISIKSSSALEAEILSTALIAADESESKNILARFQANQAVGIIYDPEGTATVEYLT
jgi:thiamine biosynthesis lipoprotein